MKKQRVMAMVMAMGLTMGTSACISATSSVESAPEQASEQEVAPIVLTDQAGRTVTIEQPVESIVSAYYITTYASIALGLEERIIGLEMKADTRPIYALAAPELLEAPQVGSLKEFNVEAVAELAPDLVIVPMKLLEQAEILNELGLTVLVVDPETQEGLEEMLQLIGAATGQESQAEALLEYYEQANAMLDERLVDLEGVEVYMGSNSSYLETPTAAMYQHALIEQAGGENVAEGIEGDYWTEVSYETILEWNPEVILLPPGASYSVEDIYADAVLADVSAVQQEAVYQMPKGLEEWDSPVPSGVLGSLWLAEKLHPEVYTQEELEEAVLAFYETFYDVSIDVGLVQ